MDRHSGRGHVLAEAACPPHPVTLASGKQWRETAIGCHRKCLFCSYTWHRRHLGGLQVDSGAAEAMWGSASRERTLFELDLSDPETWDLQHLEMVGLDGLSERLRRMVAKPITREMWRALSLQIAKHRDLETTLRGLCTASVPRGKLKVYNLVGLPTERPEDWAEFMEDLRAVDLERRRSEKGTPPRKNAAGSPNRWGIVLHSTSFRAMPATPAATWPMSYHNYRGRVCRYLRSEGHVGQLFYEGRNLWAVESLGTESLATHTTLRSGASLRSTSILDALALRGTEDDAEVVARFACSRRFWTASVARRVAMLERYLDVARLFRGCTWRDLPTRYLRSYTAPEKIKRADEAARRRAKAFWAPAGPPSGLPRLAGSD